MAEATTPRKCDWEEPCDTPAEYRGRTLNDAGACYCERHAEMIAARADALVGYDWTADRLSDGAVVHWRAASAGGAHIHHWLIVKTTGEAGREQCAGCGDTRAVPPAAETGDAP